jgi:hypothetical protein
MKVLVCGGRAYRDKVYAFEVLDRLHAKYTFTCVVHGGAGARLEDQTIGADLLAGEWAKARGLEARAYPVTQAEWDEFGISAGPRRNGRMLDLESPELVVAFPGGRGTRNMLHKARWRKCPIVEVPATLRQWALDGGSL